MIITCMGGRRLNIFFSFNEHRIIPLIARETLTQFKLKVTYKYHLH